MIDLATLSTKNHAEDGVWMTIDHPVTGEPLSNDDGTLWELLVLGQDAAVLRSQSHALSSKRLNKTIGKGKMVLNSEDLESDGLQIIIHAVQGARGLVMDGKPFEYSLKNIRSLLSNPGYKWLKEQVDTFINDRRNYLGNLSSSSSSSQSDSSS